MTGFDSTSKDETHFHESRKTLIISVGLPLLCASMIAMANGYISPDSWDYIELAQSLRQGDGCSKNGNYFAMFPCGYPLVIAAFAFSNSLADLVVASKLANLTIVLSCLLLLTACVKNRLLVAFLILNPVTLVFQLYTWSENLMFLAVCGILYSVDQISRSETTRRYRAILTLFLILGCLSRYFFGAYAAMVFLAIISAYGVSTARKCFPAFLIAGLFFGTYLIFNWLQSGHPTGIPRPPAPENFLLLSWQLLTGGGGVLAALVIFLILLCATMGVRFVHARRYPGHRELRMSAFMLSAGLGYLFLQYALRTHTYYDGFGWRTLGQGIVLALAGMAGMILRPSHITHQSARVLLLGLFIMASVNQLVWWQLGNNGPGLDRFSWRERLANYHAPPFDATTVVSLAVPKIAPAVSGLPTLWYGESRSIIAVKAAPFDVPDTPELLVGALGPHPGECVIDFSGFASLEALETALSRKYPITARLSVSAPYWTTGVVDQYDPMTRRYLLQVFSPEALVSCDRLTSALKTGSS